MIVVLYALQLEAELNHSEKSSNSGVKNEKTNISETRKLAKLNADKVVHNQEPRVLTQRGAFCLMLLQKFLPLNHDATSKKPKCELI